MTDVLQKEELDISGALISMNSMLEILETVRKDDKNQKDMIKMLLTLQKQLMLMSKKNFKECII